MAAQGLWNIGGWNLPYFGISEMLGIGPKNSAVLGANTSNSMEFPAGNNLSNYVNKQSTNDYSNQQSTNIANTSTNNGPVYSPPGNQANLGTGGGNPPPASNLTFSTNTGQQLNQADWENSSQYKFEQQQAQQQNQLRNDISSGWDSYLGQLDSILNNGLPSQRSAQEGIANNQYDQGINQLGLQNTQGMQQLGNQRTLAEQNQTKTLRDLSENVRNAFQAGNNFLGSRGAGDSSAADQYSYALTKQGNKQRGDVMNNTANILNEISGRETNLKNIFDSEVRNLASAKDQKINEVSSWFANAQNQLKQQIAQGGLGKSQDLSSLSKDLLNQGLQQIQSINQNAESRYNALVSWATSNATNINQVKSNLQQVAQFAPQLPGFSPVGGTPQLDSGGNFSVAPTGFSGQTSNERDIFGNIIRRT